MKKLLLFILLLSIKQANSQICFQPFVNYAVGTTPQSITNADFNKDGNIDLATSNYGSNDVSVLLGDGAGNFGTAANFSVGIKPMQVISADFNKDGNMDLATANLGSNLSSNAGSNNVAILFGDGTGSFASPVTYTTGLSPYSLTSADFNGDGNLDIAVANFYSNTATILLGTGNGSFNNIGSITTGTQPAFIISTDFNNDGKIDLAIADFGSDSISVFLGNGAGGFGPETSFMANNSPQFLISSDFNNDGKQDLAVACSGGVNLSVLLGDGLGSFSTATNYTVSNNPEAVACADFNGDGFSDLAIATLGYNQNNIALLLGNGTGAFSAPSYFLCDHYPLGITSADFNGDGKPDLATANELPNTASVLLDAAPPIITITKSSNYLCSGATCTLTAHGANTYTWSTTQTTAAITATPTVTTTYTVFGLNTNGCNNTTTSSVTVNQITAAFTYTPSSGSNQFFFQDSSYYSTGNSVSAYSWSFINSGGTQTSTLQNPSVVLNYSTTTVCLIVTTVNGCSDTICKQVNQTITGIHQINNSLPASIYPNPANNKIMVDVTDVVEVKLFDVIGNQITSTKQNQIDVSNFTDGVYFIQVKTTGLTTTQKIIVQH